MPDWIARFAADVRRIFERASTSQRWLLGGTSVALLFLLVGITMAFYVFPSPEFFAGGVPQSEQGDLIRFLTDQGVRYEIRDGGNFYVHGDATLIRGEFASTQGAMALGGYTYLLGPNWSQTSQQFEETKLRAHQEELERAITGGFDKIAAARVFLTPREVRPFRVDDTKATASVRVSTTGGQNLGRDSVMGIQWLVAGAMPGMKPEDVKVIGDRHKVLAGYRELSGTEKQTAERQTAEQALEEKLTRQVAEILDPVVGGEANYAITAIVQVDYDQVEIEEKFIDVNNTMDTRVRTEEISDTSKPIGDVPGLDSNNPGGNANLSSSGGSSQTSEMTSEMSEVDSAPMITRTSKKKVAPGKPLFQSVSVTINQKIDLVDGVKQQAPRSPEELDNLRAQLETAVGHVPDSTRYQFALIEMPFDTIQEELVIAESRSDLWKRNAESALFLVCALVLIGAFFYFVKRVFSVSPEDVAEPAYEEVEVAKKTEMGLGDFGLRPLGEGQEMAPEAQKSNMIREEIENFAREDPDSVAAILKNWIVE